MSVVDASVWVSWLSASDVNHRASASWFAGILRRQEQMHVPGIALAEVAGAMSRQAGAADVGREAIRRMTGIPNLTIAALDLDAALDTAAIAADLGIRGSDAAYVALSQALGLSLVTWDIEQARRAAPLIAATVPS